jgi:hypothetical protein
MFNRGKGNPYRSEFPGVPTTPGPDSHEWDETPRTHPVFGAEPEEPEEVDPAGDELDDGPDEAQPAVPHGIAPEALAPEQAEPGDPAEPVGVEELLRHLESITAAGEAPSSDAWNRLADDASSHAEILQGTLDAQKQAQRMLALATKLRGDASAQAEQILQEARAAAARLRQDAARESERSRAEIAGWAASRRQEIEATVADLLHAAKADAERIRAEAERTALEQAEVTARRYVREISAAAEREAESTRLQAREFCRDSAGAVTEVQESVQQLAEAVASFLVTSHRQSAELSTIAEKAAAASRTPLAEEAAQAAAQAAPAPVTTPVTSPAPAPAEQEADHPAERPVRDEEAPTGLPLGSLFRPHEQDH